MTWFSGIEVGARPLFSDAPAALEQPDPDVTLVWRRPGSDDPGDLVVVGPRTTARYYAAEPGRACVTMRFRPGRAAALLGMPLRDLVDHAAPAAELLTPRQVDDARRRLATAAAALLSGGAARESVASVARRLHVSERHLRTVFTEQTGLTPVQFVRIDRVRRVLTDLGRRLPEVATGAGYYDQSHMGAEFRRVMGATPDAFRSRDWPAGEVCTA
ncbi:helix-turn-helix domain-containing protein [Actinoplanes xinjiangensis]|uniref:helix-turn-helix domain-containing protein n=1 Tax=Actinoplanes xinjiangensis TaxID=512350 RepID=UPI00343AD249